MFEFIIPVICITIIVVGVALLSYTLLEGFDQYVQSRNDEE